MEVILLTGGNISGIERDILLVKDYISIFIGSIKKTSLIYESKAWGFECSDNFLNQALIVDTELTPDELLLNIWQIEHVFGRNRSTVTEELYKWKRRKEGSYKYYSRNMDIDILMYDFKDIETDLLTIPHPRITEREFVLNPLIEILGSDFKFNGKSLKELLLTIQG